MQSSDFDEMLPMCERSCSIAILHFCRVFHEDPAELPGHASEGSVSQSEMVNQQAKQPKQAGYATKGKGRCLSSRNGARRVDASRVQLVFKAGPAPNRDASTRRGCVLSYNIYDKTYLHTNPSIIMKVFVRSDFRICAFIPFSNS